MGTKEVLQEQVERKLAFIRGQRPDGLQLPSAPAETNGKVQQVNEHTAADLGFAFYRISVPDIKTLKSLMGTPDSLIEEGSREDITSPPMEMSRERETELLKTDRGLFLNETCDAYQTYIYGNSKDAESYERVINKLRFPSEVETYEIDELHLKEGEVREFGKENPEKHIAVLVNKLIMEKESEIRSYCFADFTVKDSGQIDKTAKMENCGTKGTDGNTPQQTGDAGTAGTKGEDAKSGSKSCDREAGAGGCGSAGGAGYPGGNGGNGGNGSTMTMTFSNVQGEFPEILCYGGAGGTGGSGSAGGTGGAGGAGGNASGECKNGGRQGAGGAGGVGGDGGDGGHGGNGGDIILTIFLNEGQSPLAVKTNCTGGAGGAGGKGGTGGAGGTGSVNGAPGRSGNTGNSGNSGNAGKISITQI